MHVKKQLNLIYAIKDDKIVYIDDVESGLKCGCHCPACGEPLVAKKGNKITHHFAHHAEHNCEYGYESSLHLAAKDILSKTKKFTIPAVYLEFPESSKEPELISESKQIEVDDVKLEKRFDSIIPDVVLYSKDKCLFVEIFVTHKIDEEKLVKLQKANISTIEIDLSKCETTISKEELENILLSDHVNKSWKYNTLSVKYMKKFYQACEELKPTVYGRKKRIGNCPIKNIKWPGKLFVNPGYECENCEYCISINLENTVLCSGRSRISTIKDFKIDISKRIKLSNKSIIESNDKDFSEGICPNCGYKIIQKSSNFGIFWGCSHYPFCHFKATINPQTGEISMKFY